MIFLYVIGAMTFAFPARGIENSTDIEESVSRTDKKISLFPSVFMSGGNAPAPKVRIDNEECGSSDEDSLGMCYSSKKCDSIGGKKVGTCSKGHGTCCMVQKTCRNMTKEAVAYFVNPSYPNSDTGGTFCDFRIEITNKEVCQLRLDLQDFSMAGPHRSMGICRHDRFMVLTSLPNGFGLSELCGENSGQHIYLPVDAAVGSASVTLMVMTSGTASYKWRIRSTQINCKSDPGAVAPVGCLQYFKDLSGTIESFNYNDGEGLYQSNLDYAICIKRSPNTCMMEFQQSPGSTFSISSADSDLEDGVGRAGTSSCDLDSHDYLHIPGGGTGFHGASTADKFCGMSLSGDAVAAESQRLKTRLEREAFFSNSTASPVTSYASGPIVLRFHSDDVTIPEIEKGFRIRYMQMGTGCMRFF